MQDRQTHATKATKCNEHGAGAGKEVREEEAE